ncbi:MAG: hypothetical protein O4859_06315 [Trichodesmium sp. St18_bin1]|jgi:hypothetical protein|nr:hypothetical protein [Trichodesmium sp. St18_bin1]MDE5121121.1 hypothetical protein [Trichodesmium sp. St19_bin1]
MINIINPTIDLFLYDLRNSLGDDQKDIEQNRQYFYQKFHKTVQEKLKQDGLDNDQNLEVEYIRLLNSSFAPLSPDTPLENGYYFPVRLGDSYGLLLEVAAPDKKIPEDFAELREKIQQKLGENTATLGQTWMLSTYLPNFSETTPEEIEKIAKECYKAIFPNAEETVELHNKGEFIGATIFESFDNSLKHKNVQGGDAKIITVFPTKHIIIAIYPDKATFDKLADFYEHWMRLFYYHHKIIWAYNQSRILTKKIQEIFSKIQTIIEEKTTEEKRTVNEFEEISDVLSQCQLIMNQYMRELSNLALQKETIEINLDNYDKRLQSFQKKAEKITINKDKTAIAFLAAFSKLVNEKYLLQITRDLKFLDQGLKFLENNISVIRSKVEIEKAKGDNKFQEIITVGGAGVAVVSLIGDDAAKECKSYPYLKNSPVCESTLIFKLIIFLTVSILVWFSRKYILKLS